MSDNRDVIIAYRWLHNCTVTGNEGFAKKNTNRDIHLEVMSWWSQSTYGFRFPLFFFNTSVASIVILGKVFLYHPCT